MTPAEFQAHERHFCDECRHDGRGSKACPARKIMKAHPDKLRGVKAGMRGGKAYVWREVER